MPVPGNYAARGELGRNDRWTGCRISTLDGAEGTCRQTGERCKLHSGYILAARLLGRNRNCQDKRQEAQQPEQLNSAIHLAITSY